MNLQHLLICKAGNIFNKVFLISSSKFIIYDLHIYDLFQMYFKSLKHFTILQLYENISREIQNYGPFSPKI